LAQDLSFETNQVLTCELERAQQAPLTVPTPLANLEFIKKVMLKTARAGIVA
jgi:hypothetical protein